MLYAALPLRYSVRDTSLEQLQKPYVDTAGGRVHAKLTYGP